MAADGEFEFSCPQCGQVVCAEESMRGMVLECPYCEKGIVVPKAKGGAARPEANPATVSSADVASSAKSADKAVDYNFMAIQRRLAEHQQEQIAKSEREAIRDRTRRAEAVRALWIKGTLALFAIGLCVAGVLWWKARQGKIAAEVASQRAAEEENERIAAASRENAAKIAADKRKSEIDEERKRRAAELEERRKERERQLAEAEKGRKERREAEEAKRHAKDERRRRFDGFPDAFRGMPVELWRKRPKELHLGEVDGVFRCIVPDMDGDSIFFEVASRADGSVEVKSLSRDEADRSVSREAYEKLVQNNGCLFAHTDKVYVVSPKNDAGNLYPVPDRGVDPAELVLRNVYRAMIRQRVDVSGISFDVSYVPSGGGKEVAVDNVPFGRSLSRSKILDVVIQSARKSFKPPRGKTKAKRATVVWYDGDIVKRTMNVTYVPRNPRGRTGRDYQRLCDEADRQERLARTAEAEAEQAERSAIEQMERRIDETLGAGRLKIQMRVR